MYVYVCMFTYEISSEECASPAGDGSRSQVWRCNNIIFIPSDIVTRDPSHLLLGVAHVTIFLITNRANNELTHYYSYFSGSGCSDPIFCSS